METWTTAEQLHAARDRFEAAIDGWRRPAVHGILRGDGGDIDAVRVNLNEHMLSAAVLATVCGHTTGTKSYVLSMEMVNRAIALLAPAEACAVVDHPDLAALRRVRDHASPGDEIAAVFIDDLDAEPTDAYVAAAIATALAGRHENPDGTTTLWRPTGPAELALVERGGNRYWPPRLTAPAWTRVSSASRRWPVSSTVRSTPCEGRTGDTRPPRPATSSPSCIKHCGQGVERRHRRLVVDDSHRISPFPRMLE